MKNAEQLVLDGINNSAEHAGERWLILAQSAAMAALRKRGELTAEDAWNQMIEWGYSREACKSPAAMGAVFKRLAKSNVIVPSAKWRASSHPSTHGRPQRVWIKRAA